MSATTIRMIHVACRDLGLDQDTRHELQERLTGKASLSDMNERQLKLVVDELKAKGWTPVAKQTAKKGAKPFRNFVSRGDISGSATCCGASWWPQASLPCRGMKG